MASAAWEASSRYVEKGPESSRQKSPVGYKMEACRDRCWLLGDGGGVLSSCCEGAGPVGQMGICLFGTGAEHLADEDELMEDSEHKGGVIIESGRWGGIGRGNAMVAISKGS